MNDQAERARSEHIVDAMGAIHGVHPGHRAVHAKGVCCRGSFLPTGDAAALTTARHLTGGPVPITVRFSNGSGKPTRADGAKDERGMATRFHLEDGNSTDIVALTLPVFFVKTPEDFLELLDTQRPDPATGKPDMAAIMDFIGRHPESEKALGFLMLSPATASFATATFFGIHAFRFIAPDGSNRFVRYRWVPDAGEATLTDEETRALGRDYLRADLERRLEEGGFGFELRLQLADEGDDPNDPTTPWPEDRDFVAAGHLQVTDLVEDQDRGCDKLIFDPANVTEGIERSDDPILHARSPAYSVSYERRMSPG